MTAWNEIHYARAQEFTRLLSAALADATPVTLSPAAMSVLPAPSAVAPAPTPAPPAEPLPTSTAAPSAAPTTGANLFKKIPWKK